MNDLLNRLSGHHLRAAFLALILILSPSLTAAEPVSESIGDGIVRFFESEEARADVLPSVALEHPFQAIGPAPDGFPVTVDFQREQGRLSPRVSFKRGTSLYGTGEVSGPLLRNGKKIITWNYDAYGYGEGSEYLYQSHPWVLAVRENGTSYGVLFDTPNRGILETKKDIRFTSEGPTFPVIVIDRDSPQEVLRALADLTGHMPLPPLWALGYHQCRYSYFPDSRVMEVAKEFRSRKIPCDIIWMDIDYMDGFRCFTFHPEHFPRPRELNDHLHDLGFHTVWMIDPGIKHESGFFVYDSGTEADAWVKAADGNDYIGGVWPGDCVFPDFTNSRVRKWWGGLYRDFLAQGIDGVWNDMNEPAVFSVESKTMPLNNRHNADPELGGPGTHTRYHNIYGMQMVRATREGILETRPDHRPFVLSRANHLGGHRYAATWTGDNTSNWFHLDVSIPMVLNLGLSGQPFSGPDIGGFAKNGDARLFARWFGFGALLPFARGHTCKDTADKEPWSFGPEAEKTCRIALERRYRLLPYLYTVFREASVTGLPVARPLFFADPENRKLRREDNGFLLGSDLLVKVDTRPHGGLDMYMPEGKWRRVDIVPGAADDPDQPELYIRPGGIVPVGPVMQYVGEKPLDPLTLLVRLDENGRAEGSLYEDAGDGFGFREGEYRLTRFRAERAGSEVIVTPEIVEGDWGHPERRVEVRLLLDKTEFRSDGPSGETIRVIMEK